ncbi:MAG: hypothetical protein LLG44_04200 [Chloroflexi bacterium]|nr:hypothetical protein [Chloroflexota bacterium]
MRKTIPIAAAVICGIVIIADYLVQVPWLHTAAARLLEGAVVLAGFALVLGILNLLAFNFRHIRDHTPGRWQSWIILISLPITVLIGTTFPGSGAFTWVYTYVVTPLMTALGALLLFYAVTVAVRLLPLRNGAAIILFASCLVFMILWIPGISSVSPFIAAVRNWLYALPVGASMRGLLLGAAIGAVVASLRILSSLEQPYTGITEKH